MQLINAVANVLGISENQIRSIDTWARVYFVRFNVGRPTFVSRKQVDSQVGFCFTLEAGRRSNPWVAKLTGKTCPRYGFERKFVEPVSIEWAGKKGMKSADYEITEPGYYQDSDEGYYRIFRTIFGGLGYAEASYEEVNHWVRSRSLVAA